MWAELINSSLLMAAKNMGLLDSKKNLKNYIPHFRLPIANNDCSSERRRCRHATQILLSKYLFLPEN